MPPSASDEIRAAIGEAGGAISFETFMELALYGANGFYMRGGEAGRRGDFITSPEVGPLFGAVLARALDAWWDELGQPEHFAFVDVGAGRGTLARAVRAASPRCFGAMEYRAVEVSEAQRKQHPEWVTSTPSIGDDAITGVVFANELLDNLPFRLMVMDGDWREAHVVARRDGTFAEVLHPISDEDAERLPLPAPHGARVPVQAAAGRWLRSAKDHLAGGRVVVIDYASATTAELSRRPWRDWLRTYRGQARGGHYLADPGAQDITAEVAIDQLIAAVGEVDRISTQVDFLRRWGVDQLVDEGRRAWAASAARPDLAAMTMRSRVREVEALCSADGLGAFSVIEVRGDTTPPSG